MKVTAKPSQRLRTVTMHPYLSSPWYVQDARMIQPAVACYAKCLRARKPCLPPQGRLDLALHIQALQVVLRL
mgnify:CR=1 FL=1